MKMKIFKKKKLWWWSITTRSIYTQRWIKIADSNLSFHTNLDRIDQYWSSSSSSSLLRPKYIPLIIVSKKYINLIYISIKKKIDKQQQNWCLNLTEMIISDIWANKQTNTTPTILFHCGSSSSSLSSSIIIMMKNYIATNFFFFF